MLPFILRMWKKGLIDLAQLERYYPLFLTQEQMQEIAGTAQDSERAGC